MNAHILNPIKAIILSGDGINCEKETAAAARDAGFSAQTVHVNDLLSQQGEQLQNSKFFILPGGFSFGDELGAGKILSLKLKYGLAGALEKFIESGGLVLGICNGFQALTQLEIFGSGVILTENIHGKFINRWERLIITGRSVFTDPLLDQGQFELELPIRHGEGRLVFCAPSSGESFMNQKQCVLQYKSDVNGSWNQVAGISCAGGRVLGLMPHPEAFWTEELNPRSSYRKVSKPVPLGLEFFNNAYQYLKRRA